MTYGVLFRKEAAPGVGYEALVPSLDLVAHGGDIEEARENARTVITDRLRSIIASGQSLPKVGEQYFGFIEIPTA